MAPSNLHLWVVFTLLNLVLGQFVLACIGNIILFEPNYSRCVLPLDHKVGAIF